MNATFESPRPLAKSSNMKPAKRRILLVDDDRIMRQVLSRLLTGEDFLVLTAASCAGILQLVNLMKFDLVLLDLKTQGGYEWETFGRLSAQSPMLPVILIGDRPNMFLHTLASDLGALLERPLNFTRLFHTIHNLLEKSAIKRLTGFAGRPMVSYRVPPQEDESPGPEDKLKSTASAVG
ncbi:MAG TPA: response regulator [Candidatus Acidoferrales bacterium]|nr:response regulator [Candidatus Acidoferrales bacterium]